MLSGLFVQVVDDGATGTDSAAGNGIAGMRERVRVYGGTLRAGRVAGGGFVVSATLPLSPIRQDQGA